MGIVKSLGLPAAFLAMAAIGAPYGSAEASESWDSIRQDVYGSRVIENGFGRMTLEAPFRPQDQSAVPISMTATLGEGRRIKTVSFIVDENPSPVAAVFRFDEPRRSVALKADFRLNRATDVRAVVEADDGKLYMLTSAVKFAGGQAACSAPPAGDPDEIIANMGKMSLENGPPLAQAPASASQSALTRSATLKVSHPNHTGMVMDQITLLYIPLNIVKDVEVRLGDKRLFTMSGSMTLSQDPTITFDYELNGADKLVAAASDTDGNAWRKEFPLGPSS